MDIMDISTFQSKYENRHVVTIRHFLMFVDLKRDKHALTDRK